MLLLLYIGFHLFSSIQPYLIIIIIMVNSCFVFCRTSEGQTAIQLIYKNNEKWSFFFFISLNSLSVLYWYSLVEPIFFFTHFKRFNNIKTKIIIQPVLFLLIRHSFSLRFCVSFNSKVCIAYDNYISYSVPEAINSKNISFTGILAQRDSILKNTTFIYHYISINASVVQNIRVLFPNLQLYLQKSSFCSILIILTTKMHVMFI